jgi:hypothetical protein
MTLSKALSTYKCKLNTKIGAETAGGEGICTVPHKLSCVEDFVWTTCCRPAEKTS